MDQNDRNGDQQHQADQASQRGQQHGNLPRPLQSGRSQPIAHTRSCFRLPCATQQQLPLHPWRQVSCRIFEAHGFFRKSFFEGLLMLDTAALCHALLPFQWRKAEVQQAISSPIVATFRAVTDGHFT
jgi:hypothetical protein